MRCIFVLDIFNGRVVHALRGERSRYEPIDRFSRIVASSDPEAVLAEISPKEVYVADLNRITGRGDNLAAIEKISLKVKTLADIGVSKANEMAQLSDRIVPVLGTETASLETIEEAARSRNVVASIDMKGGKVLAKDPELMATSPIELIGRLNGLQLTGIILLELDRVGTSSGLNLSFLKDAASASGHALILGGGVRGPEDLETLEKIGFQGALVATAVHNGKIPLEMVRA